MDETEIKSTIEAVLFAAGDPVPAARIALVLGVDTNVIFETAKRLADEYSFGQRGIRLVPRATGNLRDVHTASTPFRAEGAQLAYRFREPGWKLDLALE